MVTVTASIGHPVLNCSRTDDVPEGMAPRVTFRAKPECLRKQKTNENVIGLSSFCQGAAPIGLSDRRLPAARV